MLQIVFLKVRLKFFTVVVLLCFVSSTPDRMHSQVRTWTKNVDIFEKDFVFVPINERYVLYRLSISCLPEADWISF